MWPTFDVRDGPMWTDWMCVEEEAERQAENLMQAFRDENPGADKCVFPSRGPSPLSAPPSI